MGEMRSFDRRRRIADALLQSSMQPGQGGQMVGRYYVGSGITDGLVKLGQALMARSAYNLADEEESQFNAQQQATRQQALDELMQATSPQEVEQQNTVVGDTGGMDIPAPTATYTTRETRQPTRQQLAMALMGYEQKTGAPLPDAYAKMLAPGVDGNEWLGVTKTDESGAVYGATKGGGWQPLGFKEYQAPDIQVGPDGTVYDKKKLQPGAKLNFGLSRSEQMRIEEERRRTEREAAAAQKGDKRWAADQEGKLRDDYRNDTKQYKEVLRQADIITTSLADPSAAGTLAAATSFMKMLDPGSVVRESELGMAMQSTGALDRFSNYINVVAQGQVLTAEQKQDFARLAKQYADAARQAMQGLNTRYSGLAESYGLNPKNIVEFAPVSGGGWKIEKAD